MNVLESERLIIREIVEDDLLAILPVLVSDPEHLRRQEGSEGEPGRYDLARWQRDWYVGQMMPGRHMLGCYLKEVKEAVGYVDFIEEVDDGLPWLGMLLVHSAYRRQGFGTEIWKRMHEFFHAAYHWSLIHAWIAAENKGGYAFAQLMGFRKIGKEAVRLAGGIQEILQLEYSFVKG